MKSIDNLQIHIKDAEVFLATVKELIRGDVNGTDLIEARNELSNASNAIDDAMEEIDALLAPERTREESYDA